MLIGKMRNMREKNNQSFGMTITEGRQTCLLGGSRGNVLGLNLALDQLPS